MKVIYGGQYSNRTVERIIKESPLIQIFRNCHVSVEENFGLRHQTVQHAAPNMTKTLEELGQYIQSHKAHTWIPGRASTYCIPDVLDKGVELLIKRDDGEFDVDGDDVELQADVEGDIDADDLSVDM